MQTPYNIYHKGINYVFRSDWKLKANDLTLDFFFIRDLIDRFDLDYVILKNSMNVLIRLRKSDVFKCDIVFSFLYEGCKFTINGTQDKARDFKINIPYAKKLLLSFRLGNTVFDYSDIPLSSYTIESGSIIFRVPRNFNLDPVIFEDGFESGDKSQWTGTSASAGDTVTATTDSALYGTYGAECETDGGLGERAYVYKDHAEAQTAYARTYFRVLRGLPEVNGQFMNIHQLDAQGSHNALVRISRSGGLYYFGILAHNEGGDETNISSTQLIYNNTYAVELYVYIHDTNGAVELYVNDSLIASEYGLNNTANGNNSRVRTGILYRSGSHSTMMYIDSVVVDTTFIGMIGDSEPPLWSNLQVSSTLAGYSSILSSYWTDNYNMSGYIFSWNNSGSWNNNTWIQITPETNETSIQVTKTLNSTVGLNISWRVYANDTSNNWNYTSINTFTTTEEGDILSVNDMVFIFCLVQLGLGIIALAGIPYIGLIAVFLGFLLLIPVPVSTVGTFLYDFQIYVLVISSIMALISVVLHWDKLH